MSNFYISDTHFGHSNIIRHCNRPFVNADEMDEVLIKNWNSVVTNRDTVYILGDFAFSKGIKQPSEYLRELNGLLYFNLFGRFSILENQEILC